MILGLLLAGRPLILEGVLGRVAAPLSHPMREGPVPYLPYSLWVEKPPMCWGALCPGPLPLLCSGAASDVHRSPRSL